MTDEEELIRRMDFEQRISDVIPMLKNEYHLYGTARLIKDLKYCLDEACGDSIYDKAVDDCIEELKKRRDSRYMKVNCDDLELKMLAKKLKGAKQDEDFK